MWQVFNKSVDLNIYAKEMFICLVIKDKYCIFALLLANRGRARGIK